jgi:hypothetical protein
METFVDVPTVQIPDKSIWNSLSIDALISVKNTLFDRMYMCGSNAEMIRFFKVNIEEIDMLISSKLNPPVAK